MAGCTAHVWGSGSGSGSGGDGQGTGSSTGNTGTGNSGTGSTTGNPGSGGQTTIGTQGTKLPAVAAPSTLSRLTALQYANTLRDLFAPVVIPAQSPPADIAVEGFDNNASAQTPSTPLIDAYHTAAVAVATAAMGSSAQLLGCSPTTAAAQDACAKTFFGTFGKKAFRHPVTATEATNLFAFYTAAKTGGADFPTAMTLTIEAILQSPSFLYRVEIGTPMSGVPNTAQLTPYEMASRLSYLLWNTMPDDALFASADSGDLGAPTGVETQARRLLTDARAHTAILNFHSQWLRFDKMNGLTKSATAFPSFNATVAAAMQQSAQKYVDGIFFGAGTLTALLTDNHAWVNDSLASIYGVAAPAGATLTLVPVDATQRSGILTNAGLLAGFAHETADSPVLRGVFVLDRLLCAAPPPPPPTVNTVLPAPDPTMAATTRQRFATQHEQGACAGCHNQIDGIGFGFEHYDALGQWRTTDSGLPVDSTGWFSGTGDLTGTFDGAVDLGKKLAASSTVQSCVAQQWLRYALGVDHMGIDSKGLQPIVDAFVSSGLNMQSLMFALVKSDAFRTRVTGP